MANAAAELELGLLMFAVQPAQARDLGVNAGLLDDQRIARGDGLDLGVGERRAVNVLDAAQVALARHHLGDEPGLGLQGLPQVGVEGLLGDVPVDLHLGIRVALAQDAALALLDVRRTPRGVEMMQRDQALLHVGAGAHLLGAAEEDADLAGAHVAEQLQLGGVAVVVLDELDVAGGNAAGQQLVPHVLIDREALAAGRDGQVAEDQLGRALAQRSPARCVRSRPRPG